jgi:CRISPR-associated protein Cmr2
MMLEFGEHSLCRSCLLKRQEVNNLYDQIRPRLKKNRVLGTALELEKRYTSDFVFTTLAQYLECKSRRLQLPQDFEEIGQASRPTNYLGFIYADGNRMGEVVKKLGKQFPDDEQAKRAYRAFSEITDRATREAAVEAVLQVVGTRPAPEKISEEVDREIGAAKLHFLPGEFLLAGGDDLMLAVPAQYALDVAVHFIENYQRKTKEFQEEYLKRGELAQAFSSCGLTTSAGVVLAHAHYPAADLMELAEGLMKIAKHRAAKLANNGVNTGTLDFMALAESTTESMGRRRENEYHNNQGDRLTERPYTVAEARELLETIRALKQSQVPRSKLKALYPVLFQHRMQAQFDALRIKERLKATGDLEEEKPLFQLFQKLKWFPFRENTDKSWSTPLTEIIELYDFIQQEGTETENRSTSSRTEEPHA